MTKQDGGAAFPGKKRLRAEDVPGLTDDELVSAGIDFPYLAYISLGITSRFIVLQSKGDLEILMNEGWIIRPADNFEALSLVQDI